MKKWIVDGVELEVESLASDDAVARFRIDGDEIEVPFRRLGSGRVLFEMDGRGWLAAVGADGGIRHVALDGASHTVREAPPVRKGGPGGGVASGQVRPPMPGTVVEVFVGPGDAVEKGQKLVVMTAMKMETTIAAPRAGRVREVCVSAGDSVMPADLLVDLEEAAPQEGGE